MVDIYIFHLNQNKEKIGENSGQREYINSRNEVKIKN